LANSNENLSDINQVIPVEQQTLAAKTDESLTISENKAVSNKGDNEEESSSFHPLFRRLNETPSADKETFEPFHTVDYFASQGIKISSEFKADDKLGAQLKSFTEWLKTMRRLPAATVEAELEKTNESEIQKIAEHSLEEKEVITEAMAEVFARQGRNEKAVDIYHKLSLLNPDKSAYFAAKIDVLKSN